MVIDTSAILAIALGEPLRTQFIDKITEAQVKRMSAISFLEAGIVLRARLGGRAIRLLERLIDELGVEIVALDRTQAENAIHAFGRFGKGMGDPAQLNFGDCAVYALAHLTGEPILATGNDFRATGL